MATDSAKLVRYRSFAAKVETTTGTPIALTATEGKFVTINPTLVYDDSFNEVMLPGAPGSRKGSPGARSGTLTFDVEVTGNGATGLPPWASVLLPACDWEVTVATFAAARGVTTLTMGFYEDGLFRSISGARGTVRFTFETGKPAIASFTFRGRYVTPSDVALIAPTYPTVLAPIFSASTVTLGAFTPRLSRIELDVGNEVVLREDQSDATGYHAAAIVDRKPMGSFDPEASAIATKDFFTDYLNGTEASLSIALGASANNTMTFVMGSTQVRSPGRGERHGLLVDAIGFQMNGSSPLTLAFS